MWILLIAASHASASEWFVAAGGTGTGMATAPFGRIQDALDRAQPGDVVTVRPGTYAGALRTVRSGTAAAPIVVRAATELGSVVVTAAGRVATIGHAYITIENLVLDGEYGTDDAMRVASGVHHLAVRHVEIRRSSRDLVDIGAAHDLIFDGCLIHHALNAAGGRTDAHGIAAGAVRNLTIRNTEIHTFSGDGVQVDPGRGAPGWDGVLLEDVRIWLAPLAAAENGFPAGTVPGENAVDTKAGPGWPRARLAIRNTTAYGFERGLIGNMAAFNLKENVDVTLDGVTVHDSEIAFRVRGLGARGDGAWVTIRNALVYRVGTAFRYEDDIRRLRIANATLGTDVMRAFRAASSSSDGLEVRNLLVLGRALPPEASHPSNVRVDADAFVNAERGDYHLAPGSTAIDRGIVIDGVAADRDGVRRPQGAGYDAGAYERAPGKE